MSGPTSSPPMMYPVDLPGEDFTPPPLEDVPRSTATTTTTSVDPPSHPVAIATATQVSVPTTQQLSQSPPTQNRPRISSVSPIMYAKHLVQFPDGRKQCKLCKAVFTRKDTALRHIGTIHFATEQSFECHVCGAKFSRKDALVRHSTQQESCLAAEEAAETLLALTTR